MDKNHLIEELEFCLKTWKKLGYCNLGGGSCKNKCFCCPTPYLLLKMLTGDILNDQSCMRWKLENWEEKLSEIKQEINEAPKESDN